MNVTWIADYNFLATLAGGAEMSDREAFLYGLRKEHNNMQLINPESAKSLSIENTDLFVVSNAVRFNLQQLMNTVTKKPCIMYLHDYFPLCSYRLFYPMQEKCKKCKNIGNAKQLLLNSVLNIFLSPLHFDAWCFAIPELKDHPHHIHPSPVNLDLFKPMPDVKRNPKAGLVVSPAAFKGVKNTMGYCEKHPEITFTVVGGQPQKVKMPKNCAYVGSIPTPKMPSMFAQASYYVELPSTPQPYNRTILEARLMEVPHLIVNKNLGAVSYPWFNKDIKTVRKHISEAVPKWWKAVEEVMQ